MSNELIRIEPIPENVRVIEKINTLADGLKDKALYRAVRAGAAPVSALMRATAPDDPSTPGSSLAMAVNVTRLKRGQRVKVGQGSETSAVVGEGEVSAVVGPNKRSMRVGDQKFDLRPLQMVALWVEHGTEPHLIGKRKVRLRIGGSMITGPIRHPGTRPKRWMERSMTSAGPRILAEFYSSLESFLERN